MNGAFCARQFQKSCARFYSWSSPELAAGVSQKHSPARRSETARSAVRFMKAVLET
jgi:hypothetical protein